jgi:hypothetical protein
MRILGLDHDLCREQSVQTKESSTASAAASAPDRTSSEDPRYSAYGAIRASNDKSSERGVRSMSEWIHEWVPAGKYIQRYMLAMEVVRM